MGTSGVVQMCGPLALPVAGIEGHMEVPLQLFVCLVAASSCNLQRRFWLYQASGRSWQSHRPCAWMSGHLIV
jgi:hypothetical protein